VSNRSFQQLPLSEAQKDNLDSLNYREMTAIQAAALPLTLAGKDVIAQAKTGSGKTAAFGLALLTNINPRDFGAQALILCPTRELANQVAQEIRRLARHQENIKVVTLCGGQPIRSQISSLRHGAHVIVGTPGRLKDHLEKGTLELSRVATLVLDEADRMLEMGFRDDIDTIINTTPSTRQTLLFSATYPQDIQKLSAQFMADPVHIEVETAHIEGQIDQQFYLCHRDERLKSLTALLTHFQPASSILFCSTKLLTREVCVHLNQHGIQAIALHGDMEQKDRDRTLIHCKHGSCNVLVATDVAARGLDIDNLSAVFNVDMARNDEVYVHRIGRTGRAGNKGLAISLVTEQEDFKLKRLSEYLQEDFSVEAIEILKTRRDPFPSPPFITLEIAGGKRDKIRPGDILGALTGDAGIEGSAIGKISITDKAAFVAIERSLAQKALAGLSEGKIKGRRFRARAMQ